MPGPLYNQQTVSLGSLLVPYPQYGGLYELGVLGAAERYQSLELKAQKQFSKGYNFIATYVYIREKAQTNGFLNGSVFNDQEWYSNQLTWQDSNQPRNRLNLAGTWELPIRKRQAISSVTSAARPRMLLVGGWKVAGIWTFMTGDFPQFGNYIVTGNPCISESDAAALVQHRGILAASGQYLCSPDQSAAVQLPDGPEVLGAGRQPDEGFQHQREVPCGD